MHVYVSRSNRFKHIQSSRSWTHFAVSFMAKQLRLLFFGSVISSIAVFCYLNFWNDSYYGSAVNRETNSSLDATAVYISQNVETESIVQNGHDEMVKRAWARTRELIAAKVKTISDMRRHQHDAVDQPRTVTPSLLASKLLTLKPHRVDFHPTSSAAVRRKHSHRVEFRPTSSAAVHHEHSHLSRTLTAADLPTILVRGANCTALFHGDKTEHTKAGKFQSTNVKKIVMPKSFVQRTSNCTRFISKRHYAMWPVNREEEDFPIAFSILMFKDVEQFERLLRAIYRPQNLYCIHVDNKSSSDIHVAVSAIAQCFDNVFVVHPSIAVYWGYFSVLEPELLCMKKLLQRSRKWKYFINLTGQEFPLKTNWQIVQILKAFNGSNNMEGTVERSNPERFDGKLPVPYNVSITKGSVHIAVVRAFVKYVINNKKAIEFLNWVKETAIPDETFFSSLNHSPHLQAPGSYLGEPETDNDKYRFITRFKNWGNGPFNWPCHGKRQSLVCVFGVGDLPLLATRPELFANKFYLDYEPLALDCIEQLHYQRLRAEVLAGNAAKFNTSLYSAQEFTWNHA